jgi:hypothetical protein
MTVRALLLAFAVAGFAAFARCADDPPADRLEKKPKPAEKEKPPVPPAEAKPGEKSPAEPAADEDPEVIKERIAKNAQTAEERLQKKDVSEEVRQLQDRIRTDIDKLIEHARRPPPPRPNTDPQQPQPPSGGGQSQGGQPQPGAQRPQSQQQQQQARNSRRERRERQRREREQLARRNGGQQPRPGGSQEQPEMRPGQDSDPTGNGFGNPSPRAAGARQMADVVKDVWGHLPETLRQDVDHYYRDRFMPRYRELLQQYYSRLAEQDHRPRSDGP